MNRPEILAPAGSMESLTAALRAGADAVYIGGKKFSARNNASNFSADEIADALRLCHKYGAKLYLAVNTIISDSELQAFCDYIKATAEMGADGYIVQDMGAARIIKEAAPDAVLHASTQMSVHTVAGVRLLGELGFARAVPARELSAKTLERICKEDIETEVFVHGALCMSVSGQCYMSAMMGSRSANRGCCGQACRLPFSATGADKNALSLKDLSLLGHVQELAEMGVDSLKIEGRMKRPEYVASASYELKKALGGGTPDIELLKGIFSRSGFTDGYFTQNRKNMFGVREKEDVVSAKQIFPLIHELYRSERAVHAVGFFAEVKADKPVKVKAVCGGITAEAVGDIPETAKKSPVDNESLRKQFSKLGDTVFYFNGLEAEIDDGLFIPSGKLNELRRNVIEKLTEKLIIRNTPKYTITDYTPDTGTMQKAEFSGNIPVRTFCRNAEQALSAYELSEYVVLPMKIITASLLEKIPTEKIIVSPPRFIVDEDDVTTRLGELKNLGLTHLMCHTLDTVAIGKSLGFTLHGSFTLNIFNSLSAEYMRNIGLADFIFSFEATTAQFGSLCTEIPFGAVVYGRLPLMLTRNCPIANELGCRKCTGHIIDRTARKLPVACSGDYVEILNPDVLYMADRLGEFSGISFAAVLLHDENAEQVKKAVSGARPHENITKGLYYRGVN